MTLSKRNSICSSNSASTCCSYKRKSQADFNGLQRAEGVGGERTSKTAAVEGPFSQSERSTEESDRGE